MKFACFSDTCAPSICVPLRPAASIRRAAWSPGGLLNTEPALGSCKRLGRHAAFQQFAHAHPAPPRHRPAESGTRPRRRLRRVALPSGRRAGSRRRSRPGHARARSPWRLSISTLFHVAPGFAAMAAGVHRQRTADGAGNAGEELGFGAALVADKAGQLGRGDAGFGVEAAVGLRGADVFSAPWVKIAVPSKPPSRTSRLLPRPTSSSGSSMAQAWRGRPRDRRDRRGR
jgi:hypothetical protein